MVVFDVYCYVVPTVALADCYAVPMVALAEFFTVLQLFLDFPLELSLFSAEEVFSSSLSELCFFISKVVFYFASL